jgi:hypothetical protein
MSSTATMTDEKGNRSSYGDDVFRADAAGRECYRGNFYHVVTRKLNRWEAEEEYRLILGNFFSRLQ